MKITLIVGTMWCAYLFTVLALISAPSAFKSGNKLIISRDGKRDERTLVSENEVNKILRETFGIVLSPQQISS